MKNYSLFDWRYQPVEMAGYVARAARISVLPPGAAHLRRLLQNCELQATLRQLLPDADAGHPGTDHNHLEVVRHPSRNLNPSYLVTCYRVSSSVH